MAAFAFVAACSAAAVPIAACSAAAWFAAAACSAAAATGLHVAARAHRERAFSAAAWARYFCVEREAEEVEAVPGEARGEELRRCLCAFDLQA